MVRKTVPSGHKKFIYYVCGNHKADKAVCSSHGINAENLEKSVLLLLNKQIESVADMEHILGQRKCSGRAGNWQRKTGRL